MQPDYDYYKRIFATLPKPFAYLDLDLLDYNVADIATRNMGKHIRIASKSVRCVDVLRRILQSDGPYRGIMSYTAAEALYLARQGFDDILLGYPVWEPALIESIVRVGGDGTTLTFMVDSIDHLVHIEQIAARVGVLARVCIDVDMSTAFPGLHFGVRRSPIQSAAQVQPLLDYLSQSKSLRLDGIMGYEAQIAGVGDQIAGQAAKSRVIQWLKARSVPQIARRRAEVVAAVQRCGLPLRFVNGGGTGSLNSTGCEDAVTEITVGSGFYAPGLFDNYRDFRYMPAAGFAIEIVRQPRPDIYTCAGGGYVASGSAGWDKVPKPHLPDGLALLPNEGTGEVQTPLRYTGADPLHVGDPIFMRHSKAGELCERFPVLHAVQNGEIVAQMKTYRGDGQCFL